MRSEIMDGILRHIHPSGGIENARLLEVSLGHAKLSVGVTQKALNLYGNAHGGLLFSLCDTAAGMPIYIYETANITECSSINFLRGVNTGTIYVEPNAIHKSRKTVVNQVTVTNDAGKLVVSASSTMFLTTSIQCSIQLETILPVLNILSGCKTEEGSGVVPPLIDDNARRRNRQCRQYGFWPDGALERSEKQIEEGRSQDARTTLTDLNEKYGL